MQVIQRNKAWWIGAIGILTLILLYPISWIFTKRSEETIETEEKKWDALSHNQFNMFP